MTGPIEQRMIDRATARTCTRTEWRALHRARRLRARGDHITATWVIIGAHIVGALIRLGTRIQRAHRQPGSTT